MEETSGEVIKELEASLAKDLQDLKNEIEENDLVHGLPHKGISSVPIPKDAEYFRRERRLAVQRLLQVSDVRPLPILADVMREEKEASCQSEYSEQSILLLMLDHFTGRMHELANCRYEHLLRWRRFREHLGVLENLQPYFSSRLEQMMQQYIDYSARAQRLSSVRESHFYGNDSAVEDVQPDDLILYIRWLVSHLQSLRLFTQFLRVVQWTPYAHRHRISKELPEYLTNPEAKTQFEEAASSREPGAGVRVAQPPTVGEEPPSEPPTPPPMIAPTVTAHNPVSQSQFTLLLAAAATHTVWDCSQLALPLHTTEVEDIRPHLMAYCEIYSIAANAESVSSASEEMELFAAVNRKFRQTFFQQEMQRTFKTYDRGEADVEKWGLDSPDHAMRKEATWAGHVRLRPEKNLRNEETLSELRRRRNVDELLKFACRFATVSDPERVQDTLRSHAAAVANPPHLHGAAVATYGSGKKTVAAWRKIYSNPQIYDESVSFQSSAELKKKKRRDSFDFNQTMQMLGLNDADTMKDDPSGTQGAYLSYLHLRHLKIRDLRRSCLSFLNYFRSVERTLTINDQGIFHEGGAVEKSPVEHRTGTEAEGHGGGTSCLGAHAYMYSSPKDHKYHECDFMRYQDVENYDDFYTHEDGRIHVRDQRGYYVMYDIAMKDLSALEEDLILVASHFIQKDLDAKEALAARRASRAASSGRDGVGEEGDFSIGKYGHAAVDRFAVVLDMWNQESQFLQCKKALVDLYMEAYHNAFDRDEKRRLAQVVTQLLHRRPRYDFDAGYFLAAYRLECAALRLQASLLQKFMDRHVSQQREFVSRLSREAGSQGLPFDFVPKQLVAVHTDISAAKSQYLLEFHPSLCVVSRLPQAFDQALTELLHLHQARTPSEELQLERSMFEVLLKEWDSLDQLGASYTQQTKNNLFSGVFMDDPQAVASLAKQLMAETEAAASRADKKQKKKKMLEACGKVLELVTQRHRLCDLAWESEVLAKVYKEVARDTGFGEFHGFIRYIQMESARRVDGAEAARPPTNIAEVLEDDSFVDKFQPSSYLLGIQEIDEGHLGRFSFRSKDSVLALVHGSGVANLQVVLKLQTVHRSSLAAAVLLAHMCRYDAAEDGKSHVKSGRASPSDTKSERSTLTAASAGGMAGLHAAAFAYEKQKRPTTFDPESFFSVQLEKTPARNRMVNGFAAKKEASAMLMKSQSELEKLKRELVSGFCDDFEHRVRQASMRAQIIGFYNSVRDCLSQMPSVADAHFFLGERRDPKAEEETAESLQEDPRQLKSRPRRLMSEAGDRLLNLWYVPHYSELLAMFRGLDDRRCTQALENLVRIAGSLHDILQFLVGYSKLGTGGGRPTAKQDTTVDWSGSQGLGSELREIQRQVDHLPDPRSPDQVAEMLTLKRNVLFLQFDLCVRHVLRETFLASGNMQAFRSVTDNMVTPLSELSDCERHCLEAVQLSVPVPLAARDASAQQLTPWRCFISRRGPYAALPWQWHRVSQLMQLCLAGLRDVDKPIVHGELLSMSLCLEDVARSGEVPETYAGRPVGAGDKENFLLIGKRMLERARRRPDDELAASQASEASALAARPQPLSTLEQSREAYRLMARFLLLWKRVNALKLYWGRLRMGVADIDTCSRYQQFCKLYKSEKLYPIMRSLAVQYEQEELYEPGPLQADTDVFVTPKGVPEMTVRQRQLVKLLEFVEVSMITDVRKRLQRETDLVIKERNREEDNLPTDLWKRTCMKESFSMKRPAFLEEFLNSLDKAIVEADDEDDSQRLVFDAAALNSSLNQLCVLTAQNQRETYENYASFYESILKQQHQVLYDREREIQHLQSALRDKEASVGIDAQLLMAENAHELIMEVTAMRAKVNELREQTIQQRQQIRDSIIDEYREQVHSLAAVAFEQKMRLDEYRKHMLAATLASIKEARNEASETMTKIQERTATSRLVTEKELTERNEQLTLSLSDLEMENARLMQLMNRQRALANWKQTYNRCEQQKRMSELSQDKELQRRRYVSLEMMSSERTQQLQQEMNEVKEFLVRTERELKETRRKLERLQREDQDRKHADERRERSDRQLADAKQLHIDKLMEEISETRRNFSHVKEDLSKSVRTQQTIADRTGREVDALRQQLREEKKLKEDAFSKVDSLLSQVYELESVQAMSRAQTSIGFAQTPANESRTRLGSTRPSTTSGKRSGQRPASSGYAPMPPRLAQKSLTPDLRLPRHNGGGQRPRTVSAASQRLRSRVAEQLLHNIEPDHHETLMQLKDVSLSSMN